MTVDIFRRTEQALQPMPEPLEIEAVKAELAALATETGVKGAKLMTPLRYALTGQKVRLCLMYSGVADLSDGCQ